MAPLEVTGLIANPLHVAFKGDRRQSFLGEDSAESDTSNASRSLPNPIQWAEAGYSTVRSGQAKQLTPMVNWDVAL